MSAGKLITTETSKVLLPRNIADGLVKETRSLSTVARLSGAEPQRFGETDYIVFNDMPKAEFVEEGADKSSTSGGFTSVTAKPHKAQVTLRFNEEVLWADEDYQLDILSQLASAGSVALSRALDLGLYHGINPLTGTVISGWDTISISKAKKTVVYNGKKDADAVLREAAGKILQVPGSFGINGMAFDDAFAWTLANTTDKDGRPRYPQLGLGANVENFNGVTVAQGSTVSGRPEIAQDSGVRAILGDFKSGIRWGVQRTIPAELIRYGDPDGAGDLKRKNQVALRLEMVFGWYAFVDRFATITERPAPASDAS
ncbi:phage major capsid protein [Arcanobacterium phocae]|uniref:phage major capsid protein n=1 Tax=Arcanobacterium phocae TaxID=131112 RepID=UPI001C0F0CDB|nr:phage major capsid protein [Arcanobacterium phocae]